MTATEWIEQAQARCDAATEGPWDHFFPGQCCTGECIESATTQLGIHGMKGSGISLGYADAAFIAHARTDLPRALAALRGVLAEHEPELFSNVWQDKAFTLWRCPACDEVLGSGAAPDGSCATVRAIEEALA